MKKKDKETTTIDRMRAVVLIVWTVIYAKCVFVPICTSALVADLTAFTLFIVFAFAFYLAGIRAIYGRGCC